MAAITTGGSGNWSSVVANAPWPGGVLPTAADDVTIAKNHTVTLDVTTAVCNTLVLAVGTTGADVGGKFTCITTANTKLTVQVGITPNGSTGSGGAYSSDIVLDMSAAPSYKCEIVINNALSATVGTLTMGGNFTLKGAAKNEWSELSAGIAIGATTATVLDATGWRIGDTLVLASTGTRAWPPETDTVVIDTVNTGTGVVTWIGGVTYAHAAGATVGNFTRNVRIMSGASYAFGRVTTGGLATQLTRAGVFEAVELYRIAGGSSFGGGTVMLGTGGSVDLNVSTFSSNAFNECDGYGVNYSALKSAITRSRNVFFMRSAATSQLAVTYSINPSGRIGPDTEYAIFRAAQYGINAAGPEQHQTGHRISGIRAQFESNVAWGIRASAASIEVSDCKVWNCTRAIDAAAGVTLSDNVYGAAVFASSANGADIHVGDGTVKDTGSNYGATPLLSGPGVSTAVPNIFLLNRDDDLAKQELYTIQSATVPAIQRNTAIVNRSTSSMEFTLNSTTAQTYVFQVLAKAGETIRLMCYIQINAVYDDAAFTYPSLTASGLGITPVSASATIASVGAWELVTLLATNSGASDGSLTVTLSAQSATASAKAYFAGLPVAPFVTRARHYGYLFDETLPTRTVNGTIDTGISEATAAAYAGIAITWGASTSTTALTGSTDFKKLYHYSQAQGCLNVGSAMPLTGSGANGAPALEAKGNVTITGWTLNGSGSLGMGSFTLTATGYSYTGGTFSQAASTPSYSGGQLNIGAAGSFTFIQAAAMILSMTPTAPGTYVLGGSTFTGQVDLRNTAAHAITVELPSGTTYTTANNTGGVITVTTPALYQTVTVSGAVAGSRIQIYDTTSSTELYNGTPAFPYTWTDSVAAAANRAIRLRVAKVATVTAKTFIDANIGTCGTTAGTKDVSYLVNQTNDATYNTNAIDGPAIYATSGITFTDAATDLVNCNIAGGSVTYPTIYACFVHWNNTAVGIANNWTYISAPDTANYLLTAMKIRNTSATDLTVTGGFGRDATSGLSKDIIDTAGSTGNIFLAPDHVVPFSTGSGLTAGQDATLSAIPTAAANAIAVTEAVWNKIPTTPVSGSFGDIVASKLLSVGKFLGLK